MKTIREQNSDMNHLLLIRILLLRICLLVEETFDSIMRNMIEMEESMKALTWTKNEDGSESAEYQGVKIIIYQEDGLYGYYLGDIKNDNNHGFTSREYAIEDALGEINEGGAV